MLKLPPMSAVRVFEAAARHQSFTRAAGELGMTQAAVSYQVKVLEDRLGLALFVRSARRIELTPAGQRLAPAVTKAFESLTAAFTDLDRSEEVLAITALPTLAANWLVPRLGAFQLAHPRLAVRLDTSNQTLDLLRDGFDVGIRSGLGPWPGLESHPLLPLRFTPVCSPQFQRRHELLRPEDLLRVPLLGATDPWWARWFAVAGVVQADLSQQREINLGHQQLEGMAAVAGHGVALVVPAFFAADLAAGRLVQPFDVVAAAEGAYWVTYPETRRRSAKVRAFRDWILAEAAREQAGVEVPS